MRTILWLGISLLVTALLPPPAFGGDDGNDEIPWKRFDLALGGFLTGLDSSVRLGSKELGLGLDIDVEDALDLDTSSLVLRAGASYRIGDRGRHRVGLVFYRFFREATKVLATEIEIGGTVYPIGTEVNSDLHVTIIQGSYNYSFFRDDRINASFALGFFVMPISFSIATLHIGDQQEELTAPLPVLGFHSAFAFTPRLVLLESLELFYMKISSFSGSLVHVNLACEYYAWKHIGLGAGFEAFRSTLRAAGEDYPAIDFEGNIGFGYTGILIYGKYFF